MLALSSFSFLSNKETREFREKLVTGWLIKRENTQLRKKTRDRYEDVDKNIDRTHKLQSMEKPRANM